jgi:transposase
MQITTIGLDIAKNVFQVHGIDATEKVVVRKQLRRGQLIKFFEALAPCLIGMEACATAHYWARELTKLGHDVRLMPAKDVKAYVKRNKNDAADAEAICEAVRRPTMRFVTVKSAEQQGRLMQHRVRDLLMRQRTQLINALRAHLAELGIAAAQGREGIKELLAIVAQDGDSRLPVDAHASLIVLAAQLQAVQTMIGSIEKRIVGQHRSNEASKRLEGTSNNCHRSSGSSNLLANDSALFSFRFCAVHPKDVLDCQLWQLFEVPISFFCMPFAAQQARIIFTKL